MSVQSLRYQVDQVRSLLTTLQNSFHDLPGEVREQISAELDRVAFRLDHWVNESSKGQKSEDQADSPEKIDLGDLLGVEGSDSWSALALRQAHLGAWRWDLVQNTAQWSPELYEIMKVSLDKDISDPQIFIQMIHPDDRPVMIKAFDEAVQRGGPFYFEFRLIRGDGKTIWLSSSGTVDRDPGGRPTLATGINQDITDRKQTEQALRESEERERSKAAELEALMDAVPAMIWISRDPKCEEMVGNRYGYEFLEMWEGANISKTAPETEIELQPYRNFKDGREIPNDELPMQIAASTGVGSSNYEFDLVFNNGVTKNLLGNVVPLFDGSGNPAGAVAAFVDITERKRVEDELRKREAQLQTWKEHLNFWSQATNSTFWILDPDGSYLDPKLTGNVISGRPFEQVRGWKWIDILHPEDQEHARLHWQNAMVEQTAFEIESRVWHEPSRQYHWFSHRAVPLVQEGRLAGWIGASIDIQERKEMEAVRRKNEIQMATQRRLMKAREEERANIARDIHDGPLQTLIASMFEIHEMRGDVSDSGQLAGLGGIGATVTNAIHELRQVVNELRPPTLIDFGLAKAIQEHVADIQEKFPQLQLTLDLAESSIQLSEPISLSLYRICQEALRNIIRHSLATRAAVSLTLDQDQVILEIQDNGLGFSFTDDFSTLTVDKHFGLAGMKERAEAIGGTLQISSEPGQGTKVVVFAPLKPVD